jgi:hypothetical protein
MWRLQDGLSANQIYLVMIDSCHATDISDIQSCTEVYCDSNHYTVKERIAATEKIQGQNNINYNTDKLKNVFTAWENKEIEKYLDNLDIEEQMLRDPMDEH